MDETSARSTILNNTHILETCGPPMLDMAIVRPEPVIRQQVYRFEPSTGIVRAVADDCIAPNGIEFSPDYKHVYVTDTGSDTSVGKANATGPSNIYCFDITSDGERLHNRQLFAYTAYGFAAGIHTDMREATSTQPVAMVSKYAKKFYFVFVKAEWRIVRRGYALY